MDRAIQVRLKYGLTIDQAVADTIDTMLAPTNTGTPQANTTPTATAAGDVDALALYDDNGKGHITRAKARAHGIPSAHRGHPAYEFMRDADGDGAVSE